MPQISLYIDEPTLRKVEYAAKAQQISISKWVADQIRSRGDAVYPTGFEQLFGSIDDDTFVEPQDISASADSQREPGCPARGCRLQGAAVQDFEAG